VNRAVAGGVALLLFAAVAAAPGPRLLGDEARAADCVWERHSKRVVKRVKRNGKPRRVVGVRRWWSCRPVAAPLAVVSPPATPAALVPTPQPEPGPGPARLSVKATEFAYILSRPTLVAGEAIVELNNQGEDPHNLNLELEGSGETLEVSEAGPLEHRTARFDLAAGDYRLWCSLPEHEELGMTATLLVTAG
jgi:hypothetical protein